MLKRTFPLLNSEKCLTLKEALHFLHVEELCTLAEKLNLPNKAKKGTLIDRIMHFIETGKIRLSAKIPKVSCAEKGKIYTLSSKTLMLKGSYKNDLATRLFFKRLIGEYFHFTAFGIDWLNERWMRGSPPTYKEFADMWVKEYAQRKQKGSTPKQEWAYINFTQRFIKKQPKTTREAILKAWEVERARQVKIVNKILKTII